MMQPGKFGDIIICLPIARWYNKMGWDVYWECPEMYHEIFRNIDYVTPITHASDYVMDNGPFDKILDLAFGFGGAPQAWWNERQISYDSFVTAKYDLAQVPLEERWNLHWNRDQYMETILFQELRLDYQYPYTLIQLQGSIGPHIDNYVHPITIHKEFFKPLTPYNIFDWYEVIENATEIHCIDSSLANFIEVCPEFKDKKKYLYDIRESYQWLKSIYRNGWTVVK